MVNLNDKQLLVIIVLIFVLWSISLVARLAWQANDNRKIELIDTTYNHIVLDSIEYNIIKRDTIIYKYKTQMYEEIQKNNAADNDDVVRLFYQLVAE